MLEFIDRKGRVRFIIEDTDKQPKKQIEDNKQKELPNAKP